MRLNGASWLKSCYGTSLLASVALSLMQQTYTKLRHGLEVEALWTEITSHCFAGRATPLLHRTQHRVSLKAGSRIVGMTDDLLYTKRR